MVKRSPGEGTDFISQWRGGDFGGSPASPTPKSFGDVFGRRHPGRGFLVAGGEAGSVPLDPRCGLFPGSPHVAGAGVQRAGPSEPGGELLSRLALVSR